ncbi:hypothetical protein H8356DRAFT_1344142 [Neocallimastix lanati (nom. inval.)]|nr:hypothetical protein H8356DRAFT_1344142 [Neocallimastix sp. JGI-2020a]
MRQEFIQLPLGITTFEEIPEESEYYKTKNAKLFTQYNEDYICRCKISNSIVISSINFRSSKKEEALSYNDYNRRIRVEL